MKLPRFENTRCTSLTVCGCLKRRSEALRRAFSDIRGAMVARYRSNRGTLYVRVLSGRPRGQQLLHVDCATKAFFPQGRSPRVTHKKADVLNVLDMVEGSEIEAIVIAGFTVPWGELPGTCLLRPLSEERSSGTISARLVQGTLDLGGAPVRTIRWSIGEDGVVRVRVSADKSIEIGDAYLGTLMHWAEEQFELFVLREVKHGQE